MKIVTNRLVLSVAFSLLLVNCGGGGGGSSGGSSSATSATETSASTPSSDIATSNEVNNEVNDTSSDSSVTALEPEEVLPQLDAQVMLAELQIPQSNQLASSYQVDLTVNLAITARSFLNVCVKPEGDYTALSLSYQDCFIRAPMQQGQFATNFAVANHLQSLIAVVWQFDEQSEPLLYEWQFSNTDNRWLIDEM